MAYEGLIVFGVGILAGVAFGLFFAYRILKKRTKKILKDIEEKGVEDNGEEKSSQEESSKLNRGGREPRGFTDREGRSFRDRERKSITSNRELNPKRTESVEERGDIPIQPSVESKRNESVDSGSQRGTDNIQRQVQGRNKRNNKYSI